MTESIEPMDEEYLLLYFLVSYSGGVKLKLKLICKFQNSYSNAFLFIPISSVSKRMQLPCSFCNGISDIYFRTSTTIFKQWLHYTAISDHSFWYQFRFLLFLSDYCWIDISQVLLLQYLCHLVSSGDEFSISCFKDSPAIFFKLGMGKYSTIYLKFDL